MQRLSRIHSHIRGLFWTSKPFLLASTSKPQLITQLPVCTCHLSECVYVWVNIIVIQYQLRHSSVIMSKKRNALALRHKVALINEAESGKSCRQLADQFNIGRTQANSIIKRKAELLLEYDQNNCLDRKRKLQKTGNEDVNIICWEWFQTARSQNIPLSGPMLQEKALSLCQGAGKFRVQSVKWVARIFPKTPKHRVQRYLRRSGRCFL